MLLSSSLIEQQVLEELQSGSVTTLDLIERLRDRRPGTTKQGVYAALRSLKRKGVVVVGSKEAALNMSWLQKVGDFVDVAQHQYGGRAGLGGVGALRDRESIQYRFRDTIAADAFWNHTLLTFLEILPGTAPFIAYDPHVWFYLVHPDYERHLRDEVVAHGRQYLVASAYRTPLDRAIASEFDGTMSQYHIMESPLFPDPRYYLNVLGDFLIEVWMDPIVTEELDVFYREAETFDDETRVRLRALLERRGRTRLKVSRNHAKAERLRKKLLKGFYVRN